MNKFYTVQYPKIFQEQNEGVCAYKSDNIAFPHAFSTRLGGVSVPPHLKSLNLGYNRGEPDDVIDRNYEIFFSSIGADVKGRVIAGQIHSNTVRYADKGGLYEDCDGFYTDKKGIVLTVRTADCVPILFCDYENAVIGAVHAGWRGTVSGIASECVKKMVTTGADINKIQVAIGAAIHSCCYEVGADFYEQVEKSLGGDICKRFVKSEGGAMYADIVGLNGYLLCACGILPQNISINQVCTCCNGEMMFSHRASHGVRGTMCAAIFMS